MTDFAIHRSHLLPALEAAMAATPGRTTIPILSHLLLSADGDRLTVTGSDLDIEVTATAPLADCKAAGAFAAPGKLLFDMARQFPESGEVLFRVEEQVKIACGRARYKLNFLPATDFPAMARDDLTHRFALPGKALASAFDRVSHAISVEQSRYYLCGVFLHVSQEARLGMGALGFVATDGHRLAAVGVDAPEGSGDMPAIIVPTRTVATIGKLAGKAAELRLAIGETRILAEAEEGDNTVAIVSKLVDGTFPDWRRVAPTGNANVHALDRAELARAVNRVLVLAGGKGRAVALEFSSKGEARIEGRDPDAGEAAETVDFELRDGQAVARIGVNGRYLVETLEAMAPATTITMAMADPGAPILLGSESAAEVHVIMPMRV